MRITQNDYIDFYNSIMRELIDIIKEKEGVYIMFLPVPLENYNACIAPLGDWGESDAQSYELQDEAISLKEQEYGNYIDKKYQEMFVSHCKQSNYYDYEFFGVLAKKVANDIYKNKKKIETDQILDKIRKLGYDSLSKSEKEFLLRVSENK